MNWMLLFVFSLWAGYTTGQPCTQSLFCYHKKCPDGENAVCQQNECTCPNMLGTQGESCRLNTDCKLTSCNHHYTLKCSNHFCVCEYDACIATPCRHDYNCLTSPGSTTRTCICSTSMCHQRHACDSNPCHHGTCHRAPDSPYYTCTCNHGYIGQNCTESVCDNDPCNGNGKCGKTFSEPYYKCYCNRGYNGTHCENHICDAENCFNGGTCLPNFEDSHYTCHCQPGFTGTHCEVHVVSLATATTPLSYLLLSHTASTGHVTTTHHVTTTQTHVTKQPEAHRTDVEPDPNMGPYCLSCDDVVSPNTCDYITRCGPHEICYVQSFVTSIGTLRYNLGCRDSKMCSSSGKRSTFFQDGVSSNIQDDVTSNIQDDVTSNIQDDITSYIQGDPSTIDVCTRCCSEHLCNSGGCGVTGYNNMTVEDRGPVCFKCDQENSPSGCARIGVCGRDEACAVEHTQIPTTNQKLWRSFCMHINECVQAINDADKTPGSRAFKSELAYGMFHYGGIVANNTCSMMCCLHDLCNRQCRDTSPVLIG